MITKSGSMIQLIQSFKRENNDEKIEILRKEYLNTVEPYIVDNVVRLGYLLVVAAK
jgi:hypothetical protein